MNSPQWRLLLVRHGEAEANGHGGFLGRTDSPLTARGKAQTHALAEALAEESLAAIYTSPLRRAFETAKAIAFHHSCPLHVDDRLLEQDFGRWEGLIFQEAAQRYPDDFAAWQADASVAGPTGGETLSQVNERVSNLYSDLSEQYSSKTVLLVAHGGVLNVLLCALLQTPLSWLWAYRLQPGAICEVLVYPEGCVLTRLDGKFEVTAQRAF